MNITPTKAELARIPALYSQEENLDPLVHVKFFDPCGSWTWYATEYDPHDKLFFGLVHGDEDELGYFSLEELQAVRRPMGLTIERDIYWKPTPLSEVRKKLEV